MHPPCVVARTKGGLYLPLPFFLRGAARGAFSNLPSCASCPVHILILFSRKLRAIFAGLANAQVLCAPRACARIEFRGLSRSFAGSALVRRQLALIGAWNRLLLLIAGPGNLPTHEGRGEDLSSFLRLYLDANSVVIYHRLSRGTTRNYRLGRSSF